VHRFGLGASGRGLVVNIGNSDRLHLWRDDALQLSADEADDYLLRGGTASDDETDLDERGRGYDYLSLASLLDPCASTLLLVGSGVVAAVWPHQPVVNYCNIELVWNRTLAMVVESALVKTDIEMESLVSVYNPNRLGVRINHLSGNIYYKGAEIGTMALHNFAAPGGYVSDGLGLITYNALDRAAEMLIDYKWNKDLVLTVTGTISFDILWPNSEVLASLSASVPPAVINLNKVPDQRYCKCQPGYGRPPLYPMSPMQNQASPQPQRGVSAPVGVAPLGQGIHNSYRYTPVTLRGHPPPQGGCTPQRQQSALHQSCPLGFLLTAACESAEPGRAIAFERDATDIADAVYGGASPLPGPQTARQMVGREEERAEEKNIFEARLKRDLDGAKDSPAADENSRANGNDEEKVTRLSAYVICRSPKVRLVPDFLTAEECSYMISLAEGKWRPSTVGRSSSLSDGKTDKYVNKRSKGRTSSSFMLLHAQDDIVAEIERRVASLVGFPADHVERLNMLKYESGEFFGQHHDGAFRPWTVFVTLNDIPRDAGGETLFPALGLKIRPKAGTALVWPNCLENGEADERVVHEALAPRGVRKYAINCFVNEKPVAELMRGRSSSGDESDPNNLWLEYDG
ncbi:hypothetical protein FOZ63_002781, partial [Perkinsus olseni]